MPIQSGETNLTRCAWATGVDDLYTRYHDCEWGVPQYDEQRLFEKLLLEGAQAGLSWYTILKKRENYRAAFDNFDAQKMAGYDEQRVAQLLADPGIVRNRLKVRSAIRNAQAYLELREQRGSFSEFLWGFVDGEPVVNQWPEMAAVPVTTEQSQAMSRELKRCGFNFIGPTICYAFMQSVGMVNDHTTDCFRHAEVIAG